MIRVKRFNAHSKYKIRITEPTRRVCLVLKGEFRNNAKVNVIFIDDKEMKRLNGKFLHQRLTTDVLSFPLNEDETIEGEVYVNLDRAKEQAKEYSVSFKTEYSRLIIHGVLHLLGYRDKTKKEKSLMTKLENFYLLNYERKIVTHRRITC